MRGKKDATPALPTSLRLFAGIKGKEHGKGRSFSKAEKALLIKTATEGRGGRKRGRCRLGSQNSHIKCAFRAEDC